MLPRAPAQPQRPSRARRADRQPRERHSLTAGRAAAQVNVNQKWDGYSKLIAVKTAKRVYNINCITIMYTYNAMQNYIFKCIPAAYSTVKHRLIIVHTDTTKGTVLRARIFMRFCLSRARMCRAAVACSRSSSIRTPSPTDDDPPVPCKQQVKRNDLCCTLRVVICMNELM